MSSSKSSYDVFSSVDKLVSKPVVGSDGAASWQEFRKDSKLADRPSTAPTIPMKKADRLGTGMKSLQEEREHENRVRREAGEALVGTGYTHFKRNNEAEEAADRKRRKKIEDRIRPDEKDYFIHSKTFQGWKFDYMFTTRDGKTGYWWDGMDSVKKLHGTLDIVESVETAGKNEESDENGNKPKSKKRKKRTAVSAPIVVDDPSNPVEMAMNALRRRNETMMAPPGTLTGLPSGWEKSTDASSGKAYYFNRSTGERSWEIPSNKSAPEEQAGQKASLPAGWNSTKDASTGKTYYYHQNGETRWARPTE